MPGTGLGGPDNVIISSAKEKEGLRDRGFQPLGAKCPHAGQWPHRCSLIPSPTSPPATGSHRALTAPMRTPGAPHALLPAEHKVAWNPRSSCQHQALHDKHLSRLQMPGHQPRPKEAEMWASSPGTLRFNKLSGESTLCKHFLGALFSLPPTHTQAPGNNSR